jgi:hypothetical protein
VLEFSGAQKSEGAGRPGREDEGLFINMKSAAATAGKKWNIADISGVEFRL